MIGPDPLTCHALRPLMPLANIPFPCAPFLLRLFSLRHESPEEARKCAGGNQHIDLGGLRRRPHLHDGLCPRETQAAPVPHDAGARHHPPPQVRPFRASSLHSSLQSLFFLAFLEHFISSSSTLGFDYTPWPPKEPAPSKPSQLIFCLVTIPSPSFISSYEYDSQPVKTGNSLAQIVVGTNKGVKTALDSIAAEGREQGETKQMMKKREGLSK